jgi:hypothetical protein
VSHSRNSRALVAASKWFGRDYAPASILFADTLRKQDNAKSHEASLRLDALADCLCDIASSGNTRWPEDREFAIDNSGEES